MAKLAVITGASSGIGAEFARQLAGRGYSLVLVARSEAALRALAQRLDPAVCEAWPADLRDPAACHALADELRKRRVDVFVNNAGFGDCGPFLQTDLGKEMDMLDVNVRAVHILTKRIARQMQAQGGGHLLNVASCAGLLPAGPYMAAYYATKAYVASLTCAVAEELREAHSPVYVGALCPGPVDTNFNAVANVEFALKGITPQQAVRSALRGMACRRTVIVPGAPLAAGLALGRVLPRAALIRLAARQQKKKLWREK